MCAASASPHPQRGPPGGLLPCGGPSRQRTTRASPTTKAAGRARATHRGVHTRARTHMHALMIVPQRSKPYPGCAARMNTRPRSSTGRQRVHALRFIARGCRLRWMAAPSAAGCSAAWARWLRRLRLCCCVQASHQGRSKWGGLSVPSLRPNAMGCMQTGDAVKGGKGMRRCSPVSTRCWQQDVVEMEG